MFGLHDTNIGMEKCFTTIGKLPPYVDPEQPPTKNPPFSAIAAHPYVHSAELILPEEIYNAVWHSIENRIAAGPDQYARVIMPLSAILEGEFFNKYIKIGDILMISEGRSGVDNVYSLRNGILRLELDKGSYERAGLVGKAIRSGSRKHVTSRYIVELNLRLPSMLHGKRAFERIVWAFKNVLNASVSWLFCDLGSPDSLSSEDAPIKAHYPQILSYNPTCTTIPNVLVPPLSLGKLYQGDDKTYLRDSCFEIQEWLGLVSLDSPRTRADDSIDPYLSRYDVPNREECKASNLVKVTWRGLIPPARIVRFLVASLSSYASNSSDSSAWFSINCSTLGKDAVESRDGYTILALPQNRNEQPDEAPESTASASKSQQPQREFICWEYAGNSYWGI